jgi:hypothetical protein
MIISTVSFEENSNLGSINALTVVKNVEVAKKLARKLGSGRYNLEQVRTGTFPNKK